MKRLVSLLTAMLALAIAAPAQALAVYEFKFTAPIEASFRVTESDDHVLVIDDVGAFYFDVPDVPGSPSGNSYILFWAEYAQGGMTITDTFSPVDLFDLSGPQLFDIVNGTSVLRTGTFTLNSLLGDDAPYTLTITALAEVPEPEQWSLMIVGFGLAAAAIRRRTATSSRAVAAA